MHYSQKSVRSFVVRSRKSLKGTYQRLSPKYCLGYQNQITAKEIYWQPLLQGKKRFLCEIGFGSGSATWQIVRQNPEALYLGLEVYRSGIASLMQRAEEQGLNNLRIIEHDALEVLENMLPLASLDGLHLFFPDPWPKKRHQKRRIVNAESLLLFHRCLKPGGYFYFVTDWQSYAEAVRTLIRQQIRLWNFELCCNGYSESQNWRPQSKFEAKALHEGRSSFELYLLKKRGRQLKDDK